MLDVLGQIILVDCNYNYLNKELTNFLQKHGLPSVPSETFDNFEDAAKYFKQIDFPAL